MPRDANSHTGFTLIEIAALLVVAGLLVGGVLSARHLIEAARVHAQVSQIEQLRTAIRLFRIKYNALPGDMQASQAAAFGFAPRTGADGHGDGDNILEACTSSSLISGGASWRWPGCESWIAWRDLSDANLITEKLNTAPDSTLSDLTAEEIPLYFPRARFNSRASIVLFTTGHLSPLRGNANSFAIANVSGTDSPFYEYELAGSLSPNQARAIDNKIDNGQSLTGKIFSQGFWGWGGDLGMYQDTYCYQLLAPFPYLNSDEPGCIVWGPL